VEDIFVSGSWDRSVRVNNVLGKKARADALSHNDKVLDVQFRPDGKELCVSTFRGELYFWDLENE
jgi:periodic tryptophan protein 2